MRADESYVTWVEDHCLILWGARPVDGVDNTAAKPLLLTDEVGGGYGPTIIVGVFCGLVSVRLRSLEGPPALVPTAESVVDISYHLDGRLLAAGYEGENDERGLRATGLHRVRVAATGREAAWDDAFGPDVPPVEHYDISIWRAPASDATVVT